MRPTSSASILSAMVAGLALATSSTVNAIAAPFVSVPGKPTVRHRQSGSKLARMAKEKRIGIRRNSRFGQGLRNKFDNSPSRGRV